MPSDLVVRRTFRVEQLESRDLLSSVPTTFGVVGDSLSDGSSYSTSWVPAMYLDGGADFGGPGMPYNVAIGGATSTSIFSSGQVSAMQSLVASGQVDLPYLFIGGNDLLGVATQIASGSLSGAALTTTINGWINNIKTATDTIRTAFPAGADKEFVLVGFPDITTAPAGLALFDTPAEKAAGMAAINEANAALFAVADARGIPIVDLVAMQGLLAGGSLVVGGVSINTTVGNSDPHYFFRDTIHPGPIGQSILANVMMTASNVAYGTSFDPFNDAQILSQAGLSAEYTGETLSPSVDYTQFIHYQPLVNSSVAARHLFYKGSTAWDVTNANLPGFSDDNAIAPDKTAYLPGAGSATFAAVSSYSRGLNGVMVDLAGPHGTITANDFTFKVGNNNSPSAWTAAPSPTLVTVRDGAGVGGSDRVELLWADGAIHGTWLEVIVEGYDTLGGANLNTGLAASDVFYFASLVGDSGASDTSAFVVSAADEQSARNDPHGPGNRATITNVNDFNRDGLVNATDQQTARNNPTGPPQWLKFLNIGAAGPFAPTLETRDPSAGNAISAGLAAAVGQADSAVDSEPVGPAASDPQSITFPTPTRLQVEQALVAIVGVVELGEVDGEIDESLLELIATA